MRNKLGSVNRRAASSLHGGRQFGRTVHAPPSLSVALAHLGREKPVGGLYHRHDQRRRKIFATNNFEMNTIWGNSSTNTRRGLTIVQIVPGTNDVFTPPYPYALGAASAVPNLLTNYAGAGKGPFAAKP